MWALQPGLLFYAGKAEGIGGAGLGMVAGAGKGITVTNAGGANSPYIFTFEGVGALQDVSFSCQVLEDVGGEQPHQFGIEVDRPNRQVHVQIYDGANPPAADDLDVDQELCVMLVERNSVAN